MNVKPNVSEVNGIFMLLPLKGYQIYNKSCILIPSLPFSWKTNDVITLRKALDEDRAVFYNGVLPLLNFPSTLLCLFHKVRKGSYSTDRKGTKTGGVLLALLLHHCGEKHTFQEISHFLPPASWLQRAHCPHTWLTGEPLWPGAWS